MTLHGINAGRDAATPQCPEDATGQDGAERGCEGAPAQPPRSLLTCVRGAFPRHLPPLWQEPSRPGLGGMAERPPSVPRLAWLGWEEEEEEGTEDAPAFQPDEVEEVQGLQAGEWLSWAMGPVAAAGLAPSHPLWTSPAKEGKKGGPGPFPMAGRRPRSIHWAPPAPTCGQRDGGQSPQQPLSRGWPGLGSAGLGCVLQPLLQPLSSACARSLPDPEWNLPEEQEHARALFHSSAQVSAAIPTWAGPGLTAQPSTAVGALDVTCLSSLPFPLP